MTDPEGVVLSISLGLRFVLFGLECALGVSFDGVESERIFRDCVADRVSEKRYTLFESRKMRVTGEVGHYEPDSIRLRMYGVRKGDELVRRIAEGAANAYHRQWQASEEDRQ